MTSTAKKFSLIALAAIILLAGGNAFAGLRVTTPDTCWFQSNFIDLPVSVRWVNGCASEMCSFEMEMTYNPRVVQAVTVTPSNLLDDFHWPDVYFDIDNVNGTIKIAGASSNCATISNLTTAEAMMNIGFLVMGSPHSDANLQIQSFTYNEEASNCVTWVVGSLEVCERVCLAGTIDYCSNGMPVCSAQVNVQYVPAAGSVPAPQIEDLMTYTNCDGGCGEDCRGSWAVYDIIGGYDYRLSFFKDNEYDDAVTAFDASLILRYVVNHLTFNNCQKVAADVTGDGCISAYDASMIMKHLVHMAPAYPYFPKNAAKSTNWLFFNGSDHQGCPADNSALYPIERKSYSPLLRCLTGQDFSAVILGDVSGNWGAKSAGKLSVTSDAIVAKLVSSEAGRTVYELSTTLPDIYGCTFQVNGPSNVTVLANNNWSVEQNEFDGSITVAMAGVQPNVVLGRVAIDGDATIDHFILNEDAVAASVALRGDNGVRPVAYSLGNAYPNPFNPSTMISFSLPEASQVTLRVYNMLGQEVTTLANGMFGAGTHNVMWDGTNQAGQTVSTGIYLYRIEAPAFSETKKMMLMK